MSDGSPEGGHYMQPEGGHYVHVGLPDGGHYVQRVSR